MQIRSCWLAWKRRGRFSGRRIATRSRPGQKPPLEQFEAFGCRSGYAAISRIARELETGQAERVLRLRKACDVLDLKLKLAARLWVMSFKDVDVWLAGRKVATQPGDMSILTSRFSGVDADPKRIDFEIWPDERLVMTLRAPQEIEMPQGLPMMGPASNHATCVRLELDDRLVAASSWLTANGKSPEEISWRLVSAVVGVVGPLTSGVRSGPVGGAPGRMATKEVRFANGADSSIMPVSPYAEEFFSKEKVKGTWLLGFQRQCLFVLDAGGP